MARLWRMITDLLFFSTELMWFAWSGFECDMCEVAFGVCKLRPDVEIVVFSKDAGYGCLAAGSWVFGTRRNNNLFTFFLLVCTVILCSP